ncbi:MAG: hypothetical protein JRI29_07045 [Deltaproteobacteria bacterium]|nr:hypothetical protein [Deltaproteobacteria bacterium]
MNWHVNIKRGGRSFNPSLGVIMTIITLANGVDIDTSGGLRILELRERYYVVGQDLLISRNSMEEAREEIRKLKGLEC